MKRAALMCALLALAACGASQAKPAERGRPREVCPDLVQLPDCSQRVYDLAHDLDAMLSVASGEIADPNAAPETLDSTAMDCSAVHELRDRMCELTASICELAGSTTAPRNTQARCEASQQSCEHARSSGARVCP